MKIFSVRLVVDFNEIEATDKEDARQQVMEDFLINAQPHLLADNWEVEEVEESKLC